MKQELSADKDAEDNKSEKALIADFVKVPKEDLKKFQAVYEALGEWVDVEKEKKCFELNLWYSLQRGLVAKALAMLNDRIKANSNDEKAPSKELMQMKRSLYSKFLPQSSFGFVVEQMTLDIAKKFPKEYRLF